MLFSMFLQNDLTTAVDSSAVNIANSAASQAISPLDLIMKGGFIMIPIAVLFILALYIFF